MAAKARRKGGAALAERLLAVLTREMAAIERAAAEEGEAALSGVAAKGRIEAIGQMTRTLEKLFDLRRLESEARRGAAEEDGEAARLRDELIGRLRVLDARRAGGARLFGADGSFHGASLQGAPQAS